MGSVKGLVFVSHSVRQENKMKNRSKILVVDDNPSVVAALGVLLEHSGYSVLSAGDARDGLRSAYEEHPDLIVLDIGLPDRDGFTVLQRLREQTDVPILMLTARTMVKDRVRGLDEGADDYITKPFEMEELLARIRLHLRENHRRTPKKDRLVVDSHLTIDFNERRLTVDGAEVGLTPTEWRVLRRLVEADGEVVSFKELMQAGWNSDHYPDTRSIRVRISALRHKLGDLESPGKYIRTEREMGYRFEMRR